VSRDSGLRSGCEASEYVAGTLWGVPDVAEEVCETARRCRLSTLLVAQRVVGEGSSSQGVSLAPAQGGWVEFSLKHKGAYPFVTHDFADIARGAMGAFVTQGVPATAARGF
jgi:hypothetical protein